MNAPHLVLVHLGSTWFDYIVDCLEQAFLFNPHAQLWLVTPAAHAPRLPPALRPRVRLVDTAALTPTAKHVRFGKTSRLDKKFRGGFCRFATERFFFIEELMTAYRLPHAFHCENDNLLYCALAELLPVFQRHYSGVVATFDNDDRCIPGFMYFGSPAAAASLTEHLEVRSAASTENDMEMIAAYLRASPPSVIDSLPIVPAGFTCSWTTPAGKRSERPETFSRNAAAFGSVFDAAAIGQYLGGIDPRNTDKPSTVGFINESCVFDPSLFTYVWKEIAGRGRVPFLRHAGVDHRINNLHVHSKALWKFRSLRSTRGDTA